MRRTPHALPLLLVLCACLAVVLAPKAAFAQTSPTPDEGMSYLVRGAEGAWAAEWTHDRAAIGPDAAITGLRIRLDPSADGAYDVCYRARTQGGPWLAWQRDGSELSAADGATLTDVQVVVADSGATPPAPEPTSAVGALSAQAATWRRIAGGDRYETMGSIVEEGFESSEFAVVASGSNFPDALAASSLAGVLGCPLVLTPPTALGAQAHDQLLRLKVTKAYVMGGKASVSAEAEAGIRELGIEVERVEGADRSLTSVEAMRTLRKVGGTSNTVVVASGQNCFDALSIGPWAYVSGSPIILAGPDGMLPDDAVDSIRTDTRVANVLIVGGTSVVKDAVKTQLKSSYHYQRLAGDDRIGTSRDVAEWSAANGLSWSRPCVASAKDFPDALAGGPLGGRNRSVLLIATRYEDATMESLRKNQGAIEEGLLLGGERSLPIDDPLTKPAPPEPEDPMVAKAQAYPSQTGWLILVDCTINKVSIFQGSKGNWKRTYLWTVSTGSPYTPTVKGEYIAGDRGYSFGDYDHTCYYWTRIWGDYLFHSVLYYPNTFNIKDGRLGVNVSAGCVRMDITQAKWIYDNIPYGTKVVIY